MTQHKIKGLSRRVLAKQMNERTDNTAAALGALGAPGDTYIITDTRENGRKDLDQLATLKKFDVRKAEAEELEQNAAGVFLFPVKNLNFDTKKFQNRESEFSEASVNRIVEAVKNGSFDWSVFDPITVWKNPKDKKFYVLSGHSRSEAFKRLASMNAQAGGRNFNGIPAKIFEGTEEQAKELALNSNTLSTKESDAERASYYRERYKKFLAEGMKPTAAKNEILTQARQNEGNNAASIIYLSFLDPKGITLDALKLLRNAPAQDRERIKVCATWIGHLKMQFPQLTLAHENELYNFLVTNGAYGKLVRNYAEFAKRVSTAIEKNTEFGKFDASKSLNMFKNLGKSQNEKRYDEQLEKLKNEWSEAERLYEQKAAEFRTRQKNDKSITDEQILRVLEQYDKRRKLAQADFLAFRDRRSEYLRADVAQQTLFGCGSNLGKPTIKFEFETNDELKKFLQENKENLIDSYIDVEAEDVYPAPNFERKRLNGSLDGRNPEKYNYTPEQLKCFGLKPTYKKLSDYGHLITDKATDENIYTGTGFDYTEKLLIDTVLHAYKQVAPLAAHLKADNKLQSAFNVWYWLQENIRYNYDGEGLEEIRYPARTWKDRFSGVDCDCLAVFTYCLLLNMGYRPKFEIVAFFGNAQWSHIYINLDGLAIDRVLYKFGVRPAEITKKKMLEVPVYSLRGLPSSVVEGLAGLEATCLKKINDGTATARDCCEYRKAYAVRRMTGNPVEQKVLTMFMPYVWDVDLTDGSLYFVNPKIAAVASWADSRLMQLAQKYGGSLAGPEAADELNGLLKKIGNGIKKAAKATVKAVAAPVKAVAKTTAAAVKSTVNVVKATTNVVKAGVQAATGNKEAAKETLSRAGSQIKAAVVEPVKTEVNNVKTVVKESVVQPTATAVKVTADIVKVLLVKLNPVTVVMRNAFRALVGINFLGLASRLGVGAMSKDEAAKTYGITEADWTLANKAYSRCIKFFTKMGGDPSKLDKTIKNSMLKKALFKKDYKLDQVITDSDDLQGLAALGEAVTIGSCLAAVGAFFAKIWNWVKNVGIKLADWVKNHKETVKAVASTAASLMNKNGDNNTATPPAEGGENTTENGEGMSTTSKILLAAGAVGVIYLATRKKGKGKGKGKKK